MESETSEQCLRNTQDAETVKKNRSQVLSLPDKITHVDQTDEKLESNLI